MRTMIYGLAYSTVIALLFYLVGMLLRATWLWSAPEWNPAEWHPQFRLVAVILSLYFGVGAAWVKRK